MIHKRRHRGQDTRHAAGKNSKKVKKGTRSKLVDGWLPKRKKCQGVFGSDGSVCCLPVSLSPVCLAVWLSVQGHT